VIAAAIDLVRGRCDSRSVRARARRDRRLVASVPPLIAGLTLPSPLAIALLLLGSVLLSVQNAPGIAMAQAFLPHHLGTALGPMNGVASRLGSLGVAVLGVVVTQPGLDAALTPGRVRAAARSRRGREALRRLQASREGRRKSA